MQKSILFVNIFGFIFCLNSCFGAYPPPGFKDYKQIMDEDGKKHIGDQYFDKNGNCWQKDFSDGMYIYIDNLDSSKYMELTQEMYDKKFSSDLPKTVGSSVRKSIPNQVEASTGISLRKPNTSTSKTGVSLRKNMESKLKLEEKQAPYPPPGFKDYKQIMDEDGKKHIGDQYFDKNGNCWQKDFSDGMYIYCDNLDSSKYMELTQEMYDKKFGWASAKGGTSLRKHVIVDHGTGISLRKKNLIAEQAKSTSLRRTATPSSGTTTASLRRTATPSSGTTTASLRRVKFEGETSGIHSIFNNAEKITRNDGTTEFLIKLRQNDDLSLELAKNQNIGKKTLRKVQNIGKKE